jgi:hypothetical protein
LLETEHGQSNPRKLPSLAIDHEQASANCKQQDSGLRGKAWRVKPDEATSPLARYVPLAVWAVVVLTLLFISLKIIGYGYIPGGDARRHVAKAFTDKPYSEIVVLRPEYGTDQSPGWDWILRRLELVGGWSADKLMSFSVASLLLCVFCAALPWMRRPEAWLAALLAQMLAIPELMTRLTQARPYLLTEAVLIAILFSWSKAGQTISWRKIILTTIGIALSTCIHGTWYLWALPLAAFFLAGAWRRLVSLTGCVMAGVLLGGVLTGKPFVFLKAAVSMVSLVFKEQVPQWMLVGEFQPSYGEFSTLLLLGFVYLWRRQRIAGELPLFKLPVFWMFVICWILGFKADRFWADWGLPAVLVWLAWQFEEIMETAWSAVSPRRAILCVLVAAPLFLQSTNDLGRRYTNCLEETFLNGGDPALQSWLPGDRGIFYSAQMDCFYNTFYANPNAPWRYVLGMEPAMMLPENLEIFRNIQRSHYAVQAYEPWATKMRPEDRMMITTGGRPNLPQLEWTNAAGNIWIGRPARVK